MPTINAGDIARVVFHPPSHASWLGVDARLPPALAKHIVELAQPEGTSGTHVVVRALDETDETTAHLVVAHTQAEYQQTAVTQATLATVTVLTKKTFVTDTMFPGEVASLGPGSGSVFYLTGKLHRTDAANTAEIHAGTAP